MERRYIGENIRLLHDVLRYAETKILPGLLLMVDFEKAFDSVSWTFIEKALDFLNFGPDIEQWVKAFYASASTCVLVNGHYSSWFNIGRGVRQGDPLSPYLYLICAEVLSIMVRENEKIKGMNINNKEVLLLQFADDTTLCLDGSEESFYKSIQTLTKYALISGLNVSDEKTQVVWTGSRKKSQVRFLRDMNFCWDPGIFTVLGIKFSTDVKQIT